MQQGSVRTRTKSRKGHGGCLPSFDRKNRLGCRKHNGKWLTSLEGRPNSPFPFAILTPATQVYQFTAELSLQLWSETKKGVNFCSVSLEHSLIFSRLLRSQVTELRPCGAEKHSVWFVPTGIEGLRQNAALNFRFEFPKNDLTIDQLSVQNFRNFWLNGKARETFLSVCS